MPHPLSDRTRDQIVARYKQGDRLDDIAADLNVSRAAIYWTLHAQGVRPSRTKSAHAARGITVAQALEQVAAANREIGRLEAALQERDAEIARLKATRKKVGGTGRGRNHAPPDGS